MQFAKLFYHFLDPFLDQVLIRWPFSMTSCSSLTTCSFRLIWFAKLFAGYLFHDICVNIRLGESIIWVDAANVVDMELVQKGCFETEGWSVCFLFSIPHWSPKSAALRIYWLHFFHPLTLNPAPLAGLLFPWLPRVSEPGMAVFQSPLLLFFLLQELDSQ